MSRIAYVIYEKDKAGWVNILTHVRAVLLTLGAAVAASPGNSQKCKFCTCPRLRPTNLEPLGEESSNLYVF